MTENKLELAIYFSSSVEAACPFFVYENKGKERKDGEKIRRDFLAILPVKKRGESELHRAKRYLFQFFPDYNLHDFTWSNGSCSQNWTVEHLMDQLS